MFFKRIQFSGKKNILLTTRIVRLNLSQYTTKCHEYDLIFFSNLVKIVMSEIIFISCPHYSIMCRNIQITRKAQIEFGYVSLVLIWTSSNLVIIMSEFFFICSPSQPAYNDVLVSDPNSRCQQYTVLVFFLEFSLLILFIYRISSYSFRGNYSFLNLALCSVTFGNKKK